MGYALTSLFGEKATSTRGKQNADLVLGKLLFIDFHPTRWTFNFLMLCLHVFLHSVFINRFIAFRAEFHMTNTVKFMHLVVVFSYLLLTVTKVSTGSS